MQTTELQQSRSAVAALQKSLAAASLQHAADVSALTTRADFLANKLDQAHSLAAAAAASASSREVAAATSPTKQSEGIKGSGGKDLLKWSEEDKKELQKPIDQRKPAVAQRGSAPMSEAQAARQPSDVRRVELTVLSGRHLPKMDLMGTCNVFCEIEWQSQHAQTKVKKNSYSPDWEETFAFTFDDVSQGVADLSVVVMDWDRLTNPDDVGRVEVGRVVIPSETLHAFLLQAQAATEEGSFAVLKEGMAVIGEDKQPCVINLKMSLLVAEDQQLPPVAVLSRSLASKQPQSNPSESDGRWEAVDKLSQDLAAAENALAVEKSDKETKARELSDTSATLQMLYSVLSQVGIFSLTHACTHTDTCTHTHTHTHTNTHMHTHTCTHTHTHSHAYTHIRRKGG